MNPAYPSHDHFEARSVSEQELEDLFEINIQYGKVFLRVHPPRHGIKAELDDIQEELHDRDVDYLPEKLLEIYEQETNKLEVLCDEEITDYHFSVELTKGAAAAYMTIHPPTEPGNALTVEMINEALAEAGVVQGVLADELQRVIHDHIENEPFVVARGRKPVHGKDGYVQLVYGAEDIENPDALRVDHREMHILSNAKAGDVLVNIIPPTKGHNGFNVKGAPLGAKSGKKVGMTPGRHTTFNAERTQIRATKGGFVVILDKKISIENIYRVPNVDAKVGNLNFDGIIFVDGNVEDAYTVKASVRIEVKGSVGKASLSTDGEVVVGQGMLGATVTAGKSVQATFISDCTVEAGRNVIAKEYILNSNVSAGKVIQITDDSGFFHGGLCHGGNFVSIPNVGSSKIGDQTMVEVGIDPETRRHFKDIESSLSQGTYNFGKIKKNLLLLQAAREKRGILKPDHEKIFQGLKSELQHIRDEAIGNIKEWRNVVDIIKTEHAKDGGIIFIAGNVYPGAVIKIRRMLHHVQMPVAHVAYSSTKGRIQMQDYEEVIKRYRRFFL